jgi:hypothetical protein
MRHRGPEQGRRKGESYASTIYNTNYSGRANKNSEQSRQSTNKVLCLDILEKAW